MKENILIGVDLESLRLIIREAVSKELQTIKDALSKKSSEQKDVLLTRKEAADYLNICRTTLWSLDKSGELPSRRIKSKVFYLQSDLVNYLNQAA